MKLKRSKHNLYKRTVEDNKVKIQQRIQQYAFYFTSIALLLIIPWEIYKLYLISNYNLITYLGANFILILVSLIWYIVTNNIYIPQRILFVIILSFSFTIFYTSGGEYSLSVFYLIVTFPILILLLDTSLLIIIFSFYFIGMYFMFKIKDFSPTSIFKDFAVIVRFYPIMLISYFVQIFTSIGYHILIKTLSQLAFSDGVCNFSNRERFILLLKNYVKNNGSGRFSVVGIRIRSFHDLETQLDYSVINDLLIDISKRINRYNFIIKSRWSNDTFLCVLELNSMGRSKEVIHSFLRKLEEVYELDGFKWTLQFQIGVSTYPDNTKELDMLLSNVLLCLNKNPMEHGNIIYTQNSGLDEIRHKESLLNILQHEDLNNEFSLFYIPIVDLNNSNTVGCEVVIQWDSFDSTNNSTLQLIKFAEDRGVIPNITRWVLDRVFRDISMEHNEFYYSIHISILDLKDITFIPHIITLTQKYNIDPRRINFIVSEEILVDQDELLVNSLIRLHNMNFSLTLDDFGSGYSSFDNLTNLPIDQVKISKTLIEQIKKGTDGRGQKIIKGIISLAVIYNFQVVAKGVDSLSQKEFLTTNSCNYAQGDLFSKELKLSALKLHLDKQII